MMSPMKDYATLVKKTSSSEDYALKILAVKIWQMIS